MSHLVIESSPGVWGVAQQGGGLLGNDKMHCGILSREAILSLEASNSTISDTRIVICHY